MHLNPRDPSSVVLEFKHAYEVMLSICDLWEYVALDAVVEGGGVLPKCIPIYCLDTIVHQASEMRILRVEVSTLPVLFWESSGTPYREFHAGRSLKDGSQMNSRGWSGLLPE